MSAPSVAYFEAGRCTFNTKTRLCEQHHCGPLDPCLVPRCPHCDQATSSAARLSQRRAAGIAKMQDRIEVLETRTTRDMSELVKLRRKLRKALKREGDAFT